MPSEPARNLVHGLLLAVWAAVGILATLGALAHPGSLLGAGAFWLWFVGFAVAGALYWLLMRRRSMP